MSKAGPCRIFLTKMEMGLKHYLCSKGGYGKEILVIFGSVNRFIQILPMTKINFRIEHRFRGTAILASK